MEGVMRQDNNRIRDLMHRLGTIVTLCADDIEDEGDRVYFGSTNEAELLKEARDLYADYRMETNDIGTDIVPSGPAAEVEDED
jgi:hypothetical protein